MSAEAGTAERSRSRSPRRDESAAAPPNVKPLSAKDLAAAALACLGELPANTEGARKLFDKALAKEGDVEKATELLERSVALKPNEGPEKFLYLAQMATGETALAHYERGIKLLQPGVAEEKASGSASNTLRRQLARTQASVAELFMTDLCDQDNAETSCEAALKSGAEADDSCFELLNTTASLRKVQGRLDEAKELGLRCAKQAARSLWRQGLLCDREGSDAEGSDARGSDGQEAAGSSASTAPVAATAGADKKEGEEGKAPDDDDDDEDAISDEDVIQLCRTLIDLGATSEARGLLETLNQKDEEDIQVWCLLGFCHSVEKDAEGARDCANQAVKLCKKLSKKEAAHWRPNLRELLRAAKEAEADAAAENAAGATDQDQEGV